MKEEDCGCELDCISTSTKSDATGRFVPLREGAELFEDWEGGMDVSRLALVMVTEDAEAFNSTFESAAVGGSAGVGE